MLNLPNFNYQRELMCLTISGMPVPIITLSSQQGKQTQKKQALFFSSRVHPGETNASYVYQGLFKFLSNPFQHTQFSQQIQDLRESYIIKIIPCLNPDGVSCGNYRSSLSGVDLNRQWISPHEQLHPTIFSIKRQMEQISKERDILLYCDMHGHSKKKNSFMYGCNTAAEGGFNSWTKVRLFPRILARNTFVFNLKDCKFKVEKSKLGTARVVVWKQFKVTNSFTLENSFYGYDYGEDQINEFTPEEFKNLGEEICKAIWEYKELCKSIQKELNLTKGWLKPKLLLQVTGIPAAERIKQEIKDQNKEKRRNAIQNSQQKIQTQGSFRQIRKPTQKNNFTNVQMKYDVNDEKHVVLIQSFWRMIKERRNFNNLRIQKSQEYETIQTLTTELNINTQQEKDSLSNGSSLSDIENTTSIPSQFIDYSQNKIQTNKLQKQSFQQDSQELNFPLSPGKNLDWRSYFTIEELEEAYNKIIQGVDPNNEEVILSSDGSDSCPSDDNLNIEELYNVIYVRQKLKTQEIKQKIETEQKYLKEFQKYLNKQIKQIKKRGSKQLDSSFETITKTSIDQTDVALNKQIQKLKVILRSKSKEIIDNGSRGQQLNQISKQNRSFEQQLTNLNETTMNSDQSLLLKDNLFFMKTSLEDQQTISNRNNAKQINHKTFLSQERENQSNRSQIKTSQQIRLKKGQIIPAKSKLDMSDTNKNQETNLQNAQLKFAEINGIQSQIKLPLKQQQKNIQETPLAQRRLKSLESARDFAQQNSLLTSTSDYQQSPLQNHSLQQNTSNNNVKIFSKIQISQRVKSLEKQGVSQTQLQNFQNTHYVQNQYPMLPLLTMQGTNIQKGVDHAIEKHNLQAKQEQMIISQQNTEINSPLKNFTDASLNTQQTRKLQNMNNALNINNGIQSQQRINTAQSFKMNEGNNTQRQFLQQKNQKQIT